jgi:hypothetical protein
MAQSYDDKLYREEKNFLQKKRLGRVELEQFANLAAGDNNIKVIPGDAWSFKKEGGQGVLTYNEAQLLGMEPQAGPAFVLQNMLHAVHSNTKVNISKLSEAIASDAGWLDPKTYEAADIVKDVIMAAEAERVHKYARENIYPGMQEDIAHLPRCDKGWRRAHYEQEMAVVSQTGKEIAAGANVPTKQKLGAAQSLIKAVASGAIDKLSDIPAGYNWDQQLLDDVAEMGNSATVDELLANIPQVLRRVMQTMETPEQEEDEPGEGGGGMDLTKFEGLEEKNDFVGGGVGKGEFEIKKIKPVPVTWADLKQTVGNVINPLRAKIDKLLKENEDADRDVMLKRGRFHGRSYIKAQMQGHNRVFAKRNLAGTRDYAIYMMIDCSRSTESPCYETDDRGQDVKIPSTNPNVYKSRYYSSDLMSIRELEIRTIVALTETVDRFKEVRTAFGVFHNDAEELKGFADKWTTEQRNKAAQRMLNCSGGTDLEGAANMMADSFDKVRSQGKIAVIITDGAVSDRDALAVKALNKKGIEVIVLTMGFDPNDEIKKCGKYVARATPENMGTVLGKFLRDIIR